MPNNSIDTPKEYIDSLPTPRQKDIRKLRSFVRKHLPKGYKESIRYGMLNYEIGPDEQGNKRVSLSMANQKSYMAIYFSNIYDGSQGEKQFRDLYQQNGHKLNMGKSCLRFKSIDDLNLDFLEKLISGALPTPF